MRLFPTVFLLGLAGWDPTGAIVIISALALGVSKREILVFALTILAGTVATGLICSRFIGTGAEYLAGFLNDIPDHIYLALEFVVSLALLKWFIERVFFKTKKERKEERKESFFVTYFRKGLFVVGLIFSASALTDPSFLALLTLCGQTSHMLEVVLANCTWILISQSPVFGLTAAVMLGRHEGMIGYFREKMENSPSIAKLKQVLSVALSVVILLAGLLTLLESMYFWLAGEWLF